MRSFGVIAMAFLAMARAVDRFAKESFAFSFFCYWLWLWSLGPLVFTLCWSEYFQPAIIIPPLLALALLAMLKAHIFSESPARTNQEKRGRGG